MDIRSWIWIGLAVFIVFIVLLDVWLSKMNKKNKMPIDYYTWFVTGMIWIIIGIPFHNIGLIFIGLIFMILSLIHKKEWKKNHAMKAKCCTDSRMTKILLIAGMILLVGIILLIIMMKR